MIKEKEGHDLHADLNIPPKCSPSLALKEASSQLLIHLHHSLINLIYGCLKVPQDSISAAELGESMTMCGQISPFTEKHSGLISHLLSI